MHLYHAVLSVCLLLLCVYGMSGAGGEPEGVTAVTSEGEQCGAPAGNPQRPGPLYTPLQHCS